MCIEERSFSESAITKPERQVEVESNDQRKYALMFLSLAWIYGLTSYQRTLEEYTGTPNRSWFLAKLPEKKSLPPKCSQGTC